MARMTEYFFFFVSRGFFGRCFRTVALQLSSTMQMSQLSRAHIAYFTLHISIFFCSCSAPHFTGLSLCSFTHAAIFTLFFPSSSIVFNLKTDSETIPEEYALKSL